MSQDTKHVITIMDTDNEMYPILVRCTCAFQCHCRTEEEAQHRKRFHEHASLMLQATKGWQMGHR